MLQLAPLDETLPDPPVAPPGAPALTDARGARRRESQHLEAAAPGTRTGAPRLHAVDLDEPLRQQVADGAARRVRVAVETRLLDVAVRHDPEVPEQLQRVPDAIGLRPARQLPAVPVPAARVRPLAPAPQLPRVQEPADPARRPAPLNSVRPRELDHPAPETILRPRHRGNPVHHRERSCHRPGAGHRHHAPEPCIQAARTSSTAATLPRTA